MDSFPGESLICNMISIYTCNRTDRIDYFWQLSLRRYNAVWLWRWWDQLYQSQCARNWLFTIQSADAHGHRVFKMSRILYCMWKWRLCTPRMHCVMNSVIAKMTGTGMSKYVFSLILSCPLILNPILISYLSSVLTTHSTMQSISASLNMMIRIRCTVLMAAICIPVEQLVVQGHSNVSWGMLHKSFATATILFLRRNIVCAANFAAR